MNARCPQISNQQSAIINPLSRRELLARLGAGFGSLGLATVLGNESGALETPRTINPLAPKPPHFEPKVKRVIYLVMNGGPSHVDTFDHKPKLVEYDGKPGPGGKFMPTPFKFARHGQSGLEVSEIYPHLAK